MIEEYTLSDNDLSFMIETVAPELKGREQLVKGDEAIIEGMLNDERLFDRAMGEEKILTKISTKLFFDILLRQTKKDMEKETYTVERTRFQRIPVFDSKKVVELLNDKLVKKYLVDMLSSYTKVRIYTLSQEAKERIACKYSEYRLHYKMEPHSASAIKRVCIHGVKNIDMDGLLDLYKAYEFASDESGMFEACKLLGDVRLFILGMFPEYVESEYRYHLTGEMKPPVTEKRRKNVEDREEEGKEFYRLAAKYKAALYLGIQPILNTLSENFTYAKKPLNYVSDHYVQLDKYKWFAPFEIKK